MSEALLCRDRNWGRWERSSRHDNYMYGFPTSRFLRWENPVERGPKWKDQIGPALETIPFLEERSQREVLNARIDKIYDELSELIARRTGQLDPMLEEQITSLTQELRSLQKQEADLVREYTRAKLAGPVAEALEILKQADQIRARYGITTSFSCCEEACIIDNREPRGRKGKDMARNEKTSKQVAKVASTQLRSKRTGPAGKKVAGSALTQAPDKKQKRK